MRNRQSGQSLAVYGCGAAAIVAVVGIILVLFSGANVQPGYVGVVGNLSGVDVNQQPLPQGFHPVMPFVTHIEAISMQPQNHKFARVGAASRELQNVYVTGGVNYHVEANSAAKLVIAGGVDAIVSKVFDPAFQDYIKEVVPTYAVTDILPNRSAIRAAVQAKLADKATKYGITVDDVFITQIDFDPDYTKAIEAKQVASQQLEQAKIEAQTAVAKAEGQANAKIAQAEGDAKANVLRQKGLSPLLIQWLIVNGWDGHLPQVVGGNASPFITLK